MTRADIIRSMSDKELAVFLFELTVNQTAAFLEKGGAGCMFISRLADYLSGEYNEEKDTLLSEKPLEDEE